MTDLAEPLVAGLLAGWGVAIPLGAIGVMVVDLGMRSGLRPAAVAAAGVATADFLYAALAAAAGAAVAGALEPHERTLRLGAAAVLALVAALGLLALRRRPDAAAAGAAPPARGLYLRFLALTSINPLTVAYFAALIAGLPAVASAPAEAKLVFVLAAGAASLSWQLVLAGAGAALHRRLPASARLYTALAGNALVLALALHMALAA
jgi:threonine/homoserine/homoserine lactone efflux protein